MYTTVNIGVDIKRDHDRKELPARDCVRGTVCKNVCVRLCVVCLHVNAVRVSDISSNLRACHSNCTVTSQHGRRRQHVAACRVYNKILVK